MNSSRSGLSETFLSSFAEGLSDETLTAATELLSTRRVLDFSIQSGQISAKVHEADKESRRVDLHFTVLPDQLWSDIFNELAMQSYFLALLLSGEHPEELEAVFEHHTSNHLPVWGQSVKASINGDAVSTLSPEIVALLLKFANLVDESPFKLFLLYGRGREEILLEIRQRRRLIRNRPKNPPKNSAGLTSNNAGDAEADILTTAAEKFWSSDKALEELSYTIRADELPAAVLKRLDPLPLDGLEDEIDYKLEEAYEKIARLAQSFGLGL